MKILCAHAHFDDFEFVAAGLFARWRQHLGTALSSRVLVCTDGKAGHHFRTRDETGRIRIAEQRESAKVGGYEFEQLLLPDGTAPREACLQVTIPLLAAFWKAIRSYEPDYLFCPPLPNSPLAGIHVDHVAVAEAVRKVAYMINVPHAFTPEYPAEERVSQPCKVPVIINVHDGYMTGANSYDFAIEIEDYFPIIAQESYCHQSQISEWLPWVARHDMHAPKSLEDWSNALRQRFLRRNREMGIRDDRLLEFYTVTAWGYVPSIDEIVRDIPGLSPEWSHLLELKARLNRWRGL
jgi:LmbE family N-acetylglucosaminyl deacetylase